MVDEENEIEINSEIEIKPINLTIRYLHSYDLDFNGNWNFNLNGEIEEYEKMPLGSIGYLDIQVDNSDEIAGCEIISKNSNNITLLCKINNIIQDLSNKIIIPKSKTTNSTLKFIPDLINDIKILVYKELSFKEGKYLVFNEDNKWQYSIRVKNLSIPIGSKSIMDILYNGRLLSSEWITNFTNNETWLDCIIDKEEQKEEDLVKIQFIKSEKSTITWNDLTYVYEIPIEKELEFTKVYDLHLDYSFNNNKFYTLKIDYINNILPENGLVKIDVKINNNLTYANCYNQNSTLDCIIEELINEGEKPLLKLSHIKKYGSITWKNF